MQPDIYTLPTVNFVGGATQDLRFRLKDNHGNIVESRRDTLISQDVITANADRTNYAPMKNIGNLENKTKEGSN